jgi:RES domain-containing protein
MHLWRVSPHTDLARSIELKDAGRWAWASRAVLYCSTTPELAALEALAHWEPGAPPHWLCRVTLPRVASIGSSSVERVRRLPEGWTQDKAHTRALGNHWVDAARSAVLLVPSALCAEGTNALVNPAHPAARGLRLRAVRPFRFDRRLTAPR